MTIRRAHPADAPLLTRIAQDAKRVWGYPEEWMALWQNALTVTEAYIADHDVQVSEVNSRIVGFYALVEAEAAWELDHLWVLPESMNQGVGRRLFAHAVERLRVHAPGTTLAIESDPHAEAFYRRMGARRVGERVRRWQGIERRLPCMEFSIGNEPSSHPKGR